MIPHTPPPNRRLFEVNAMDTKKLHTLITSALLAALCFCTTLFLKIPFLNGYIHLGDCFCLIAGWLMGPVGALASGLGSALSDLAAGYPVYIPATFVIKAGMTLIAFLPCRKRATLLRRIFAAVLAELTMVVGYFLYEWAIYGIGGALPAISGNLLQAAGGILTSLALWQVLAPILKKSTFKF